MKTTVLDFARSSAALTFAAALCTAPALAAPNRTGLPVYPGSTDAFAPDADAQFTCHEYHANTGDAAPKVIAWYRARFPGAKVKTVKFGFFDNSTLLKISGNKEIVVSPPNSKATTVTEYVLYAGTGCPEL